jgi:tetratricopeptide (TPR) repeat protein
MYLRGSKWNMRQRRPRINWFLIVIVVILIAIVTYVDRFILPTAQTPFMPTPTVTRSPESYVTEAEGLFNNGKLLQAIDTYTQAIRLQPEDPTLYIALARVQIFAGKYDEALVNAENSLLLNNNNSMAYAVRGWALTYKLDYTNADDSLKNALRLDDSNGQAHAYNAFLYGKMYENNAGPYTDPIQTAISESNAAISLAPDSLEAHWARAYILGLASSDQANLELAVQQYLAAIKINGNIAQIHLELGVTYKALGTIDLAIQQYTAANKFDPSSYLPELYSSRADAFIGEFDKALQWADAAVRDAPVNADLRGNWGYMLYKTNAFSAANEQLSLAINGGTTADGQTIQPLSPTSTDIWVSKYYYAYAISLAQTRNCSEMLLLTQKIRDYFRADPYAALNADIAEGICTQSLTTPSSQPSSKPLTTPGITPTP